MYKINLKELSELAQVNEKITNCNSCEFNRHCGEFDYNYCYYQINKDLKVFLAVEQVSEEVKHQEWLDDMTANCEEYLPYETQDGFVPLDEEDFDEIGF